jgi:hypothetical protein
MRYLLIQYIRKPNGQIDELVQTSRKLKKSDMNTKNTTFEQMTKYYKRIYPKLIEQLEMEAPIEKKDKRNKK